MTRRYKRGPWRALTGEELLGSDGKLYQVLSCGHAVLGRYDKDGMPTTEGRPCFVCGGQVAWKLRAHGFVVDVLGARAEAKRRLAVGFLREKSIEVPDSLLVPASDFALREPLAKEPHRALPTAS